MSRILGSPKCPDPHACPHVTFWPEHAGSTPENVRGRVRQERQINSASEWLREWKFYLDADRCLELRVGGALSAARRTVSHFEMCIADSLALVCNCSFC